MSQVFSKLVVATSFVSGHHIPTNTDFETDMYFDGVDIHFITRNIYRLDGSSISLDLGFNCTIESDLRPYIYAHPIYQDILREHDPDDHDWHQQWKEDEAMGN